MNNKTKIILFGIISLGFFLRFVSLSTFPHALHRDEAFLGYNAYSILKTGRDMTGDLFPLHLKSFIYSPGGYSYFSIPFIDLFGLNEFSIRFASAFFGSLSIIIVFLLTKEIFYKKDEVVFLSVLASGLFAILPWHINLSRTATENVVVVFFLLLGTYFFVLWSRISLTRYLLVSFMFFVITLFLYQAPRSYLPFYVPLLVVLFAPRNIKKNIPVVVLYFVLIILPIIAILFNTNLSLRIKTVSIFATQETQLVINDQLTQESIEGANPYIARVFHNKITRYFDVFINNYLEHLSPSFFFTESSYPDRYRVPLSGIVYLIFLPFAISGIYFLMHKNKKEFYYLLGSFLLVPLGSALTFDDIPNIQRTLYMAPTLCIFTSVGFYYFIKQIHNRTMKIFFVFLTGALLSYSFAGYLRQYYIHQPVYRPWFRNDGYRELVKEVNKMKGSYKKVIITNRESAPAIFFLVYSRYDPKLFQEESRKITTHDFDRVPFGDYVFVTDECPFTEIVESNKRIITGKRDILYVNSALCNTIKEENVLETIKRKDGSEVFHISALK